MECTFRYGNPITKAGSPALLASAEGPGLAEFQIAEQGDGSVWIQSMVRRSGIYQISVLCSESGTLIGGAPVKVGDLTRKRTMQ